MVVIMVLDSLLSDVNVASLQVEDLDDSRAAARLCSKSIPPPNLCQPHTHQQQPPQHQQQLQQPQHLQPLQPLQLHEHWADRPYYPGTHEYRPIHQTPQPTLSTHPSFCIALDKQANPPPHYSNTNHQAQPPSQNQASYIHPTIRLATSPACYSAARVHHPNAQPHPEAAATHPFLTGFPLPLNFGAHVHSHARGQNVVTSFPQPPLLFGNMDREDSPTCVREAQRARLADNGHHGDDSHHARSQNEARISWLQHNVQPGMLRRLGTTLGVTDGRSDADLDQDRFAVNTRHFTATASSFHDAEREYASMPPLLLSNTQRMLVARPQARGRDHNEQFSEIDKTAKVPTHEDQSPWHGAPVRPHAVSNFRQDSSKFRRTHREAHGTAWNSPLDAWMPESAGNLLQSRPQHREASRGNDKRGAEEISGSPAHQGCAVYYDYPLPPDGWSPPSPLGEPEAQECWSPENASGHGQIASTGAARRQAPISDLPRGLHKDWHERGESPQNNERKQGKGSNRDKHQHVGAGSFLAPQL